VWVYSCSMALCLFVCFFFLVAQSACAIIVMQVTLMLMFVGGASVCTGIVIQTVFMVMFVE
jgi:hypothetical protein